MPKTTQQYKKVGFGLGGPATTGAAAVYGTVVWCIVILWALAVTAAAIVALVFAVTNQHWRFDDLTNHLVSRHQDIDVEVRAGSDLIVHDRVLHSGTDVMLDKVFLSPTLQLFPPGQDLLFGDRSVPYSRLQAGLAIGLRLGTDSVLTPPGILFGEDGLKVLVEPFGVHVASAFFPVVGVFVPSDARIKTDVRHMDGAEALRNVLALRPRTYHYTDEWYDGVLHATAEERAVRRRGFVAQELRRVLPNSVRNTTYLLGGKMVDDFMDVRKEDIVTDVVGALQLMLCMDVLDVAYAVVDAAQTDNLRRCISQQDREIHPMCEAASCVCMTDSVDELCRLPTPPARMCDPGSPFRARCAALAQA